MAGGSFSWRASTTILPSVFVCPDHNNPYYVQQANGTGTGSIVGISQEGTYGAPGTGNDNGYAANVSGLIMFYENDNHDEPLLLIGAAVTAGQFLTADTSGRGIPVSTQVTGASYPCGAISRETNAVSGTLVRVIVTPSRWVYVNSAGVATVI